MQKTTHESRENVAERTNDQRNRAARLRFDFRFRVIRRAGSRDCYPTGSPSLSSVAGKFQITNPLVFTAVLIARNFLRRCHPVIRVLRGVNTTTGCAALGTLMNFICWRVFYSHFGFPKKDGLAGKVLRP